MPQDLLSKANVLEGNWEDGMNGLERSIRADNSKFSATAPPASYVVPRWPATCPGSVAGPAFLSQIDETHQRFRTWRCQDLSSRTSSSNAWPNADAIASEALQDVPWYHRTLILSCSLATSSNAIDIAEKSHVSWVAERLFVPLERC